MREMKDSGVEWIGEIPKEWETGKTLYALSMPITDGPHETPELFDEGIPFVSAEAVSCGNGHIDFEHIRGYISQEFYDECCKKYIPQINDVYMIKSGATTGKVAKVETDEIFTIWSPLAVFRVDDTKYYYEYLYYFIQSDGYQKQIENKWTYGTQQNIGMRTLEKLFVCFPPLAEQKKISDYLDSKCAKIDSIIEKQKAIIEKLKEYKLSVITEAVTKGLNPVVEMKDSGIEWIGPIAKHFETKKLKFIADILDQYRSPISAEDRNQNADILYDYYGASGAIDKIDGYTIDDHVMLIGEDGANLRMRNLPLMYEVNGKAWINNHAHILKPHKDVDYYYLFWALECLDINNYITGSAQPKLNQENLKNIMIPIPDYNEQIIISRKIVEIVSNTDKSISKRECAVEKLLEYKKSLIYEVVTGKKGV